MSFEHSQKLHQEHARVSGNNVRDSQSELDNDDDEQDVYADVEFVEELDYPADNGSESYERDEEITNMDDQVIGLAQDMLPDGLYGCWLLVSVRDFKGHSSGKEVGNWDVAGNTTLYGHESWTVKETDRLVVFKREIL